ncbi:MAG TPA: hypothetical protein PLG31_05080 [Spirochaetota bacterium]|nr:hypothetical protein [Spirochaetota bacterium]HPU87422.1 hypothetical protein [Spirochaetota bacterium]
MKKLMVLLTLAAVSLGTGCIHYVRGDLGYINEKLDANKEPKKIAYRVNTSYYGAGLTYGDYEKEEKVIGKVVGDLFNKNVLYTEQTLKKKPENLFFDVSVMFHQVSDEGDLMGGAVLAGLTFMLYPNWWSRYNIYFAVDVYDKNQVSTPEGAGIALGDNRTFRPLARYEYQQAIVSRWGGVILWALVLPCIIANKDRALTRVITDMTKEFMCDLKDGRKNIVSHNHWRGSRGLTLAPEQVGDYRKGGKYRDMLQAAAGGMMAASSAMNTYASMQQGAKPGMSPAASMMNTTQAVLRITKDLSLVAKSASDIRTQKKMLAYKNDNPDMRFFATDGDPFKYKGGVKLWWVTYKTSKTGDQQFLDYFSGIDDAKWSHNFMSRYPDKYQITSNLESKTFGSPSAAVQFIRNKAKQIGDKRYIDIKL